MAEEKVEPMSDAEALAFTVKEVFTALKKEGFTANFAAEFVKSFFHGGAAK